MRFTEHELTLAVTGAARTVAAARGRRRRTDDGAAWDALDRLERYHLLDAVGGEVLPVLLALPDVEVAAGTRPTFTDQQLRDTVEECVGEGKGLRRRARVLARATLVASALAALPVRQDPDALLPPAD